MHARRPKTSEPRRRREEVSASQMRHQVTVGNTPLHSHVRVTAQSNAPTAARSSSYRREYDITHFTHPTALTSIATTPRKTKSLLFRTSFRFWMAGCTRLELVTSDVTARILLLNCSFACLSVLCFCRSRNCRRSGACVRIAPRRDSSVIVTEAVNLIALLQ